MDLGLPGEEFVRVVVPEAPVIQMPVPAPANTVVVPVPGPPGPAGNPFIFQEMVNEAIDDHVNAPEPHPAYDDLPSLVLLFENGLI